MPHVQSQTGQINRKGQSSKSDMKKAAPHTTARNEIDTAYDGDENRGSKSHPKMKPASEQTKGRRLPSDSDKTPIR